MLLDVMIAVVSLVGATGALLAYRYKYRFYTSSYRVLALTALATDKGDLIWVVTIEWKQKLGGRVVEVYSGDRTNWTIVQSGWGRKDKRPGQRLWIVLNEIVTEAIESGAAPKV